MNGPLIAIVGFFALMCMTRMATSCSMHISDNKLKAYETGQQVEDSVHAVEQFGWPKDKE